MINCKLCGRCCYYLKDGKFTKCKHLVKLGNGKTLCRIYNRRLGTIIDKGVICMRRCDIKYDYIKCPFNTTKEIQDVWGEIDVHSNTK